MDATRSPAYPARAYAWYVIFVLVIATLLSLLDRQLPALLVPDLKTAFGASDTQISLLQGSAFAVIYSIMGLPFGVLVDRTNRRNLIIAGLLIWSVMTLLSGFTQSYAQLLIARIGVGIGEACLAPAAYSIIADYVPARIRGRALAVYYAALSVGAGASLLIGGVILRALVAAAPVVVPFLGAAEPWRLLFILAGMPGAAVALLLLTVREPQRRDLTGAEAYRRRGSLGEFWAYLRVNGRVFAHLLTSYAIMGYAAAASMAWAPTYYLRRFDMPISQAGQVIGVLMIVSGVAGALLSGVVSDRWSRNGARGGRFRVMLIAWGVGVPATLAWPLVNDQGLSLACLTLALGACSVAMSSPAATIQDIVPNRMRGQAIALNLLLVGLIGMALGPTAPALISDYIFKDPAAIGTALALAVTPLMLVGAMASWSGLALYSETRGAIIGAGPQPPHRSRAQAPTI